MRTIMCEMDILRCNSGMEMLIKIIRIRSCLVLNCKTHVCPFHFLHKFLCTLIQAHNAVNLKLQQSTLQL